MIPSYIRTLVLILALAAWPAAAAGDASDFAAALERTAAQFHFAMRALETSGRDETAAEVRQLRADWQDLFERFAASQPAAFAGDGTFALSFTDIDTRLVGALIVIELGSRDAARAALAPIGELLARLRQGMR